MSSNLLAVVFLVDLGDDPGHPQVAEACDRARSVVKAVLEDPGLREGGEIVYGWVGIDEYVPPIVEVIGYAHPDGA